MARLSLSFPLLLSAVPLWKRLWSEETEHMEMVQCWFSDGGITSNFPIHFFDSPLPRWPTFGINLGPGRNLDPKNQSNNIYAPLTNRAGIQPRWGRINRLTEFARALADTMQNWMDSAQARVPGYRDRIVLVKHTKDEGGMNLNMDSTVFDQLSERGRCAGEFLVKRFSTQPSGNVGDDLSWENHRWARYRSVMPLIEDLLIKFVKGYDWPPEPQPNRTYDDLIGGPIGQAPGYRWCLAAQRSAAESITDQLIQLARSWGQLSDPVPAEIPPVDLSPVHTDESFEADRPFVCGAPRPRPALRITRDF
jgi:hypothetical protein